MIKNTPLAIYSLLSNVNDFINNLDRDYDLFRLQPFQRYNKTVKYLKIYSEKICKDVEGKHYDHRFILLFCLWQVILYDKYDLRKINKTNMIKFKEMFYQKQLYADQKYIMLIEKELQLGGLKEYFRINDQGISIIYKLIKDNKISVIFFLKYFKKVLTYETGNNIFKTIEYMRFEKIINKMYGLIKGV